MPFGYVDHLLLPLFVTITATYGRCTGARCFLYHCLLCYLGLHGRPLIPRTIHHVATTTITTMICHGCLCERDLLILEENQRNGMGLREGEFERSFKFRSKYTVSEASYRIKGRKKAWAGFGPDLGSSPNKLPSHACPSPTRASKFGHRAQSVQWPSPISFGHLGSKPIGSYL